MNLLKVSWISLIVFIEQRRRHSRGSGVAMIVLLKDCSTYKRFPVET